MEAIDTTLAVDAGTQRSLIVFVQRQEQESRTFYQEIGTKLKKAIRARSRRLSLRGIRPEDTQDLVQETFCRALRAIQRDKYDATRESWPYLAGICVHVLSDMIHDRVREERGAAVAMMQPRIDTVAMSEEKEELQTREMLDLAARWRESQPQIVQALYDRRFVQGESQRTAAQSLGLSRQRVRTLEAQMRASLVRFAKRFGSDLPTEEKFNPFDRRRRKQ